MWALFTTGVFALLYKITQEADEELKQTKSQHTSEATKPTAVVQCNSMDIRYVADDEDVTRYQEMLWSNIFLCVHPYTRMVYYLPSS